MNKFSLLENFNYSNEEIEDFFLDFIDDNKFRLEEGFIDKENHFLRDVAYINKSCKLAKHITIDIDDVAKGVSIQGVDGKSLTEFDTINKVLTKVKMFYERSKEPINYIIEPRYDSIYIHFILIGPLVDKSHFDTKDEIYKLLSNLRELLIKRRIYGHNRTTLKGNNWLEIKIPQKDGWQAQHGVHNLLSKIRDGIALQIPNEGGEAQNTLRETSIKLNQLSQEIIQKGYLIYLSGGDNQIVIQLKKV